MLDAFAGPARELPAAGGRPRSDAELDQLTPREREVLQHIARGYMYKEIALRLGISAKTVEAHVSAVLRKLQLSSRHELSRWAAERQMLDSTAHRAAVLMTTAEPRLRRLRAMRPAPSVDGARLRAGGALRMDSHPLLDLVSICIRLTARAVNRA